MIFQSNERKFKFYLLELNDVEHVEMTNLITNNGGEVCAQEKPPAIKFTNCESYDGKDPVFHINYIRECVKYQQILDLINFKIGPQGYYGCLMSIFVYGENMCSFVEDTDSCCSYTQIKSSSKYSHTTIEDHKYARGDFTMVQETSNARPQPVLDITSQEPQFIPAGSLPDSEFLPDRSTQSPGFLPEKTPRDSEFMPAESPPDVEFLPDDTSQNSELIPVGTPRDSEFLPHESPQHSRIIPDGPSSNSEFVPPPSPPDVELVPPPSLPDVEFLPNDTSQNSELIPVGTPRDSEFLPNESPQHLRIIPDGPSSNSEFVPPPSPPDVEFVPPPSLPDVEFLPNDTSQNSELIPVGTPRDSQFLPHESSQYSGIISQGSSSNSEFVTAPTSPDLEFLPGKSAKNSRFTADTAPQNLELIPTGFSQYSEILPEESQQNRICPPAISPGDSDFFPEESQSSIETIVIERTQDRTSGVGEIEYVLESPESVNFEELNYDLDILRVDQSLSKNKTPCKNSHPMSCDNMTIIHNPLKETNNAEFNANVGLPCLNVNEVYPLSAAEEEIEASENVPVSVKTNNAISLNARLERLRTTKLKTLDRRISSRFKSRELKRNSPTKNIVDEQPVAGGSKTVTSPTILRNESRVESDNEKSLNIRSERLQTTQLQTVDRATSPKFKSRELERNSPAKNIVDEHPVAGGSKTVTSPTILRNESRVELDNEKSLNIRSERLQTTQLQTVDRATSPKFKSRELERNSPAKNMVDEQPVAGGSKTVASPTILRNESRVESDNEKSLNIRSERLKTTQLQTMDRATSPNFKSRKLKRKLPAKNIVDEQPVAGGSKTAASPPILRDKSREASVDTISLSTRLDRLQTTKLKTLDRATSPKLKSRKLKRKSSAKNMVIDKEPVAGTSKTSASPIIPRNKSRVESDDNIPLSVRLERLQTTRSKTLDRATSLKIKSKGLERKSPNKYIVVDKEPAARASKILASPTILRDEFNRIKILGGSKESCDNVKQFRLTSSDTDDTDRYSILVIPDCKERKSVNQNSSSKIREDAGKKKVLKKHRVIRSPLRDSDMSEEDQEVTKVLNNIKRTIQRSRSDSNSDTSTTSVITSRVTNRDKNTVVNSTRSSANAISISNSDTDLSSVDVEASSASSRRVVNSAVCPTKTKTKVHKVQNDRPLKRNYLPWEQREMIKYLIDKNLISEARGNRVWKRMIEDGYLKHRTVLSLNNHFRKNILPKIHMYRMEHEHLKKFQKLLE